MTLVLTTDKRFTKGITSGTLTTDAFGEPKDVMVLVSYLPESKIRRIYVEIDGKRTRAGSLMQRGVSNWTLSFADGGSYYERNGKMAQHIEKIAHYALYRLAQDARPDEVKAAEQARHEAFVAAVTAESDAHSARDLAQVALTAALREQFAFEQRDSNNADAWAIERQQHATDVAAAKHDLDFTERVFWEASEALKAAMA